MRVCARRKLANKVVLDVGLCLCVYDIEKIVDSYILPGDAGSHTKVHFRVCALRPFIGEVCCARIRANTRHGLYLTLKFFDDIFVPADKLPTPSVLCVYTRALREQTNVCSDETEQVWYWQYAQDSDEAADSDEKVQLFMDVGKLVRSVGSLIAGNSRLQISCRRRKIHRPESSQSAQIYNTTN
jgi:DNA-directed RNA polymerase III subunit RPC8